MTMTMMMMVMVMMMMMMTMPMTTTTIVQFNSEGRLNVALVRKFLLTFQDDLSVYIVQAQAAILLGLSDLSIWDRCLVPKRRSPNYPPQPHDKKKNKDFYCVAV
jgi:hypothetical protein